MAKLPTTEAGEKFLELYAEPVVTNTYLKIAILVLALVSSALLILLYRAQTSALHLKPLIIPITGTGRAEVLHVEDFGAIPIEQVSKYYLARWATLYYGRNHATLERDFADSLAFLANDLEAVILDRVRKGKTLEQFLLDPAEPNVDVEVESVTIDDLRQAPYRARIEFEKVYRSTGDREVLRRERWTANVVYSFREETPNAMLLTNPLGLAISYFREDQAFGS
jgi:type IV secretory pathway TrbF-like protein